MTGKDRRAVLLNVLITSEGNGTKAGVLYESIANLIELLGLVVIEENYQIIGIVLGTVKVVSSVVIRTDNCSCFHDIV